MEKIEIHSIANILPYMTEPEFIALKNDISRNGLLNPIVLYKGKVIDGRNRLRACNELNIKPEFINYAGTEKDLFSYVISLNVNRRHLSISQKSCIAIEILPEIEKRTKENLSKQISDLRKNQKSDIKEPNTLEKLSIIFNISQRSISSAKKLHQTNIDLFNEVLNGKITLNNAMEKIKPMESGNNLFANLQNLKPESGHTKADGILKPESEINKYSDGILKPEPDTIKPMESGYNFTKKEITQINDYMQYFNISKEKAENYIISRNQAGTKKQGTGTNKADGIKKNIKSIKFLISEPEKLELKNIAKNKNISVSELIRTLIKHSNI